ncbi:MAG TPA: class I SAM-dependent methyltransferase [Tissierellales bacterium]|nr:class I SAM-dependent methyltransferase [Tissierellales bacterium]
MLDFGCGNGVLLFKCALRGTENHRGIDISKEAIKVAKEIQKGSKTGNFAFTRGEVKSLETIPNSSYGAIVLSNIIDNLIPSDAIKVLVEIKRILKGESKILIKLNHFLTEE